MDDIRTREYEHTVIYSAADYHNPDHAGHSAVWHLRLPAAARKRLAQRGLSHHSGECLSARCQPGDHGFSGCAPARKTVLHDCRPGLDDFIERARQHQYYPAIHARPEYRRRCTGRAGDDRQDPVTASTRDAGAAFVSEGEPRRLSYSVSHAEFVHHAPLRRG